MKSELILNPLNIRIAEIQPIHLLNRIYFTYISAIVIVNRKIYENVARIRMCSAHCDTRREARKGSCIKMISK